MIVPEPSPPDCWVTTLIWTTLCLNVAATDSGSALRDAADNPGWVEELVPVELLLPNCQPANRPMPKISRSTTMRATIALLLRPRDVRMGESGCFPVGMVSLSPTCGLVFSLLDSFLSYG